MAYSYQNYDEKKMARALGVSLPISYKQAAEISNFLKNKTIDHAKKILERVVDKKQAIPFKRFNRDTGHKPGIAAGRYPKKASLEILKIINSAEKNAEFKGLGSDLVIVHMNSHRAPAHPRTGRVAGEAKRAHVEVVLAERSVEKKEIKK